VLLRQVYKMLAVSSIGASAICISVSFASALAHSPQLQLVRRPLRRLLSVPRAIDIQPTRNNHTEPGIGAAIV